MPSYFDFSTMNETDVREVIVRPFLERLGYRHGTLANIRTEVPLRYAQAFLGRKNPSSDPALRGRADYVCEFIPYGRWVVEVKAPLIELSEEDAAQAHTYAAHPEIAARYYLLTNGREFRLYQTGAPFYPILSWKAEEMEERFYAVRSVLGPDELRRAGTILVDPDRPLAEGLRSSASVVGGYVLYENVFSSNQQMQQALARMVGTRASVREGSIARTTNGLIEATVSIYSPYANFDDLNRQLGFIPLVFRTSGETLSTNANAPSILSNMLTVTIPPGTTFPTSPLSPAGVIPSQITITYYINITCALATSRATGIFSAEQNFSVYGGLSASVQSLGSFELALQ